MTMSILSPQKFTNFPSLTNCFAAGRSFFYSSELSCALQVNAAARCVFE
jgi:hypothetical protein